VALWCGNNEIDLSYEWSNSTVLRSNRNMFVVDYQAVFIDTVRKNIKQVCVCVWAGYVAVLLLVECNVVLPQGQKHQRQQTRQPPTSMHAPLQSRARRSTPTPSL
jgi:hypothetical protein